jgi:hypothetical protein
MTDRPIPVFRTTGEVLLIGRMMPAFGQALPGEEIAALVDYLDKCRDKHKPAGKP